MGVVERLGGGDGGLNAPLTYACAAVKVTYGSHYPRRLASMRPGETSVYGDAKERVVEQCVGELPLD